MEKQSKLKFGKIRTTAEFNDGIVNISGLSEGRTAPIISLIAKERGGQFLVVTSSKKRAEDLVSDIKFYLREEAEEGGTAGPDKAKSPADIPVMFVPEDEKVFLNYEARSRSFLEERLRGVLALTSGRPVIAVTTAKSALKKVMPKEVFLGNAFTVMAEEEVSPEELVKKLVLMGYEKTVAIDVKGQFSRRGDILDIFPYDRDNPVRIEFFGDEVDSLKEFDAVTQRSVANIEEVSISSAQELLYDDEAKQKALESVERIYRQRGKKLHDEAADRLAARKGKILENISTGSNVQSLTRFVNYFYDKTETLIDYMSEKGCLIIEDFDRTRDRIASYEKEIKEEFKTVLEKGEAVPEEFSFFTGIADFERAIGDRKGLTYIITPFSGRLRGVDSLRELISVRSRPVADYANRMEVFLEDVNEYRRRGFTVNLVCESEERRANITDYLARHGARVDRSVTGILSAGSEFTEEKTVYISDRDIFAVSRAAKKSGKKNSKPIKAFIDIKRGDYVVHENHGIGRFEEITQLEIEGIKRDYLKIQYAGEDVLYVPADQMDSVQKYIGGDVANVRVNRLSSGEWNRTKAKVREAIREMAVEIMQLSAERRHLEGYAFSPDSEWQRDFENSFPFVETEDQLKCTEEIKKDMQKPVPMERLLCGDVGYGKTEVAARAVFKCLADGKQAAILVPTTILANQHYNTFRERMEPFPFRIDLMSRFRTAEQQKQTAEDLKAGKVDLVIGTHRLLSGDVEFKNLGLLIIDEEQRFGVQHKEAIKLLRKNVDVLTLTATPIPRTLHMSLIGARDMSLIEEPPEDRYPVQTYVMQEDPDVIREAITSEIERGGQCFVVYNRVRDINTVANFISRLVPEAEIAVGHGKMSEESLENVIIDFIEQKTNVLICTTIIETGIDMPNANTIIILDADRFGLSQLYQLRGRVGRSTRMAYAFLMYKPYNTLSETAEKRLTAIKEFTELGSGFKIAMRDLEIRGAGNILGVEQSGHMVTVGYELYCKMLDEAIGVLKGERLTEEEPEASIEIEINAYIPEKYISDESQRIEMYQKIAAISSEKEREDVIDEIMDRFGELPAEVYNLTLVALIKVIAGGLGIDKISEERGQIKFSFVSKDSFGADKISRVAAAYGRSVEIFGGRKPYIKMKIKHNRKKVSETAELLKVLAG